MKQTITKSDFRDAFRKMGRNNQFSYEGLGILFDYFELYEEETGAEVELDVIAICCEYAEATWEEIAEDYGIDVEGLDETDTQSEVMNYLELNTVIVGEVAGGCVYRQF
jgi:hypothetical protein